MYSRKLPLFAFVLTLAGILFLTAFRSADAIKEGQPSQTNAPLLGASHEPVLLPDPIGAMRLVAVDVADNLRRTPTTLDWRKAEGPTHKSLDFFKLMRESTQVPDSILHDLRLLASNANCVSYLSKNHDKTQTGLTPTGLTDVSCELIGLFNLLYDFQIYDYAMYPVLSTTSQQQGHEVAFGDMLQRVQNQTSNYCLIGKQIWLNSPNRLEHVTFRIALQLPDSEEFDEVNEAILALIQSEVEKAMQDKYTDLGGGIIAITDAQMAGIIKLKEIIQKLIANTYTTEMGEAMLVANGFWEVEMETMPTIDTTGAGSISSNLKDYSGLRVSVDGVFQSFGSSIQSGLAQTPYGITVGAIITDNSNYSSSNNSAFSKAVRNFNDSLQQDVVTWFHYFDPGANGQKKLFYKWSFDNLTEAKANQVVGAATAEYLALVEMSNPAAKGENTNMENRMEECNPPCILHGSLPSFTEWPRARNTILGCMDEAVLPTYLGITGRFIAERGSSFAYEGALACGIIDGFLDLLGAIYFTGKGLYAFAEQALPMSLPWGIDAIKKIVTEASYYKAIEKKTKGFTDFWGNVSTGLAFIGEFILGGGLWDVLYHISMMIQEWVDVIKSGTVCAGYLQGQIIFEMIVFFLTDGATTAIGPAAARGVFQADRLIEAVSAIKGRGEGLRNFISKVFRDPEAVSGAAKKGMVDLRTLCRRGMEACFLAGTVVHTAGGTEDISKMPIYFNEAQNYPSEFVLSYQKLDEYSSVKVDKNSDLNNAHSSVIDDEEIIPETWSWVELQAITDDGYKTTAKLRRPIWWLKQHNIVTIGEKTWLTIPEMGIANTFTIINFTPSYVDTRNITFPATSPYIYRPITGWFERDAPEVWDYVFSSNDTISVTPNHPFFSKERQTYIAVEDLRIGENIETLDGKTVSLISKMKRFNGQETVYNLEVWKEHNFHIGKSGILVHNSCIYRAGTERSVVDDPCLFFDTEEAIKEATEFVNLKNGLINNRVLIPENYIRTPTTEGAFYKDPIDPNKFYRIQREGKNPIYPNFGKPYYRKANGVHPDGSPIFLDIYGNPSSDESLTHFIIEEIAKFQD